MKVSIIGAAGNIGSCAAFNIAVHSATDELVMIDSYSPDKLEQYVFDLTGAVTGLDVKVRAGGDEDMRGSDIVLIAAGSAQIVASRTEVLPQNLPLIQDFAAKIKRHCPEAIVVTATNPVDPLNYAVFLSTGFDRRKLIGYSANDSIRFRMFVSEAMGVKSSQVDATVIGEHGNSQVLVFSSVRIDGKPVKLTEDIKQKVGQQVANLPNVLEPQRVKTGRTAAWTTSIGLTAISRAIRYDTRELIPCSVVLDGEYDCRDMSVSVPVIVGREGISEIQEWDLEQDEQEKFKRSVDSLKPAMKYVEGFLGG